jgi:hypothetical protein
MVESRSVWTFYNNRFERKTSEMEKQKQTYVIAGICGLLLGALISIFADMAMTVPEEWAHWSLPFEDGEGVIVVEYEGQKYQIFDVRGNGHEVMLIDRDATVDYYYLEDKNSFVVVCTDQQEPRFVLVERIAAAESTNAAEITIEAFCEVAK